MRYTNIDLALIYLSTKKDWNEEANSFYILKDPIGQSTLQSILVRDPIQSCPLELVPCSLAGALWRCTVLGYVGPGIPP
jgi:hypothetical protein